LSEITLVVFWMIGVYALSWWYKYTMDLREDRAFAHRKIDELCEERDRLQALVSLQKSAMAQLTKALSKGTVLTMMMQSGKDPEPNADPEATLEQFRIRKPPRD
jgi:hypothetical protein